MTLEELNGFLIGNPNVEWAQDQAGNLLLRHTIFDNDNEKIKIEPQALAKISVRQLEKILVGGRNIDHITRVTGYFSRVSGWNKGKKAELQDRQRVAV